MRDDDDNGVPDWLEDALDGRADAASRPDARRERAEQAQAQRREAGKVIAVAGDRALHGPTDVALFGWRVLSCGITGAMVCLELFLRWVTDAKRREELQRSEKHAQANGGKLPDTFRERSRDVARARMRTTIGIACAVLVGLGVACVRVYSWGLEEWCVSLAMLPLLWVAKEYKAPVLGKASVALPAVAAVMGVESWRWWPTAVAGVVIVSAFVLVGHQVVPATPKRTAQTPAQRYDYDLVWNTVELEGLRHGKGVVLERKGARPLSVDGRETGVAFRTATSEPIGRELLQRFEFKLTMPVGGAVWIPDPKASGMGELRLSFEDGLPAFTTPRRQPCSLSYNDPIPNIGKREGGRMTDLCIARVRMLMVGNSGSGKSSALQDFLDAVCDMLNADWYGIDVQDGPTFKPYRRAHNCRGLAFDRKSARAMIEWALAECLKRNAELDAGMDEDDDGIIDQWYVVSDKPGKRGIVLFIDELSSLTIDAEIADLLIQLLEVCRKGSITVIMATPDLDAKRVPSAVLDQANIKMGFGCPFTDAQRLFGKGSTQSGWNAWELIPSAGDQVNDAGKCYVHGAGFNLPEITRWGYMKPTEIAERNKIRRLWTDANRHPDGSPKVHTGTVRGSDGAAASDDVIEAEIVESDHDRDVAALRAALAACGDGPGLRTAVAEAALGSDALERVRRMVRSRPTHFVDHPDSPRAFRRQALVDALTRALARSDSDDDHEAASAPRQER